MARPGAGPVGGPIPPSPLVRRLLARIAAARGARAGRRPACPGPPATTYPPPEPPDAASQGSQDA